MWLDSGEKPMWNGTYKRWNPLPRLEGARVYCEAVHDDWEGFRIWLRPEEHHLGIIVVRFGRRLFYTNSDEGDRLSGVVNEDELQFPHPFWTVEDSALVTEFRRQAAGVRDDVPLTHYAFLTCNDCIDVIATEDPVFVGPGDDA